jgi:hypothetical protein
MDLPMRKGSVTVTTAVQISRICMVAGVSQVDCSTVQIGGFVRASTMHGSQMK